MSVSSYVCLSASRTPSVVAMFDDPLKPVMAPPYGQLSVSSAPPGPRPPLRPAFDGTLQQPRGPVDDNDPRRGNYRRRPGRNRTLSSRGPPTTRHQGQPRTPLLLYTAPSVGVGGRGQARRRISRPVVSERVKSDVPRTARRNMADERRRSGELSRETNRRRRRNASR